jgi:hypothetical protein
VPNTLRLRRGFERAIKVPVAAGTMIQVGDMVYEDAGGNALPASSLAWGADLATTQGTFKGSFLGISRDQRLGTEPTAGYILVDTRGEAEMNIDALGAALQAGALLGPAKQAGNALENQEVAVAAAIGGAIGRLVERAPVGATTVLMEFRGTVHHGPLA